MVSELKVDLCESDVRRPSMMGASASPPAGSSDRTVICWASRMAGGVRTPECEKMVGIALEYRRRDGLSPGTKDDEV
jgi:hypothetical protein